MEKKQKIGPVETAQDVVNTVEGWGNPLGLSISGKEMAEFEHKEGGLPKAWGEYYKEKLVTAGIDSIKRILRGPTRQLFKELADMPEAELTARMQEWLARDWVIISCGLKNCSVGKDYDYFEAVGGAREMIGVNGEELRNSGNNPIGREYGKFSIQQTLQRLYLIESGRLGHFTEEIVLWDWPDVLITDRPRLNTSVTTLGVEFAHYLNLAAHFLCILAKESRINHDYGGTGSFVMQAMEILSSTPVDDFGDYLVSGIISVHDALIFLTAENPDNLSEEEFLRGIVEYDLVNKLAAALPFGQFNLMSRYQVYYRDLLVNGSSELNPELVALWEENKRRSLMKAYAKPFPNGLMKEYFENGDYVYRPTQFFHGERNDRYCPMTRTRVIADMAKLLIELALKFKRLAENGSG